MRHSPDSFVVIVDGFPTSIGPAEFLDQRAALLEQSAALVDLMHFYDRARGAAGNGEGWTAADVRRLEQIRFLTKLVWSDVRPNGHSRPPEARGGPKASGKPAKSRKVRETRQNGS